MTDCICPVDGYCQRYRREMTGRVREICNGVGIASHKAEIYKATWRQLSGKSQSECAWRGEASGELLECGSCPTGTKIKVFECGVHGNCTIAKSAGVACCKGCSDFLPRGVIGGKLVKRFDEHNLSPSTPGKRFNTSIVAEGDGYILAYRTGWKGSEINLIRLDAYFAPVGDSWQLSLSHSRANYGREDPRLFWHNDRVHVAYIGVTSNSGKVATSVLYARLTEDLQVEEVFYPHLPERHMWEKNWSMFSHGGTLYATYAIAPHRILRIDGNHAEFAYESIMPAPWHGGEMRGGASPILIGNEFWHVFHDRIMVAGVKTYRAGIYTFTNKPPFRVQRFIAEPIMVADGATRPGDQYCACVFPCGAVVDGDDLVISSGVHDRWTELQRFSIADLESRMRRIGPPAWWAMRTSSDDTGIFASVAGSNEYSLPDDMSGWKVLDVGGHVGSFAYAARERGAAVVHCYEPYAPSADLLEQNAAKLGNVTVFREAMGVGTGCGRHPAASEVEHSGGWTVIPGEGDVPIIGLDTAIERLGEVDLLKIDCEGGEWPAFAGVKDMSRVKAIVGEWHNYSWNGRQWRPEDLAGLLEPHGFKVEFTPQPCGWGLFKARRP